MKTKTKSITCAEISANKTMLSHTLYFEHEGKNQIYTKRGFISVEIMQSRTREWFVFGEIFADAASENYFAYQSDRLILPAKAFFGFRGKFPSRLYIKRSRVSYLFPGIYNLTEIYRSRRRRPSIRSRHSFDSVTSKTSHFLPRKWEED